MHTLVYKFTNTFVAIPKMKINVYNAPCDLRAFFYVKYSG